MHVVKSLVAVAGVLAVTASSGTASAELSTVVAFDPAQGELPESITADSADNIYLSMGSQVKRVTPSGQVSVFASLPVPAGTFATGLKFGDDGYLYAGSASFSPTPPVAAVWRIAPDGAVTQYATLDPNGFPNDLAFDEDGNLFVTDPFLGQIWRIDTGGQASIWLSDPALDGNSQAPFLLIHEFGCDGIAFDKQKDNLYIGNLDYGTIVRVGVDGDGSAGDVEVWVDDFATLAGADGIAFDHDGSLYVAVNGQDRLAVVDPDGTVSTFAQGGLLDAPSSVVFGTNEHTKRTLYVSSFAINRALGTQPGAPHPALLQTPVDTKGLPLP